MKEDQIDGTCSTHDRKSQKISVGETVGLTKGQSGNLVIDASTKLKQMLQKQYMRMWTGYFFLRTRTG
jgi:hypothetical protein